MIELYLRMIYLMQIEIYQWLVPVIGLYFIYRTINQYVKKRRTVLAAVVWVIFWIGVITLAIIPNQVSFKIAEILGFKSNVTAVIFVAIGMLFFFVFYLSSTVERLENQLTDLVRKLAIEEHKNKTHQLHKLEQDSKKLEIKGEERISKSTSKSAS